MPRVYLFSTVYEALGWYGRAPIPKLKSLNIDFETVICPAGHPSNPDWLSDLTTNKHIWAFWCVESVLNDYPHEETKMFRMRYIGLADLGNDTEYRRRFGAQEIALIMGVSRHAVGRITGRILDDIENEMIRRGVLARHESGQSV